MSFVIDETSFDFNNMSPQEVVDRLDNFWDLVEKAERESHRVFYSVDLFECEVIQGYTIFDLYDPNAPIHLSREVAERINVHVSRMAKLEEREEIEISDYDLILDAEITLTSYSIPWVHAFNKAPRADCFCCLVFQCGRKTGFINVEISNNTIEISFVGCLNTYQNFFRKKILLMHWDDYQLDRLSESAFANLKFANEAINRLGELTGQYRDLIEDVVHHFSVLSDEGIRIFTGNRQFAESALGSFGVTASDENGATKANHAAQRARTVMFSGTNVTCWWHSKLKPHINRIYFSLDFVQQSPPYILIGRIHAHL